MRQIAVIGLGNFGSAVARELTDRGVHVIAIDRHKERVESIKESVTYAVTLDSTDINALRSVGMQDVDVAVVCIGDDIEANLLTTILLKKSGVKKIWARAISLLQKEILKALEVDEIIALEEEMGKVIANGLASANITKHIPLALGHSIAEIKVPEKFVGKTMRQIDPRKKYSVNIVAVKKNVPGIDEYGERTTTEQIEDVPSPDAVFSGDEILFVVGNDDNIKKFSNA